jgi:repressor LexA
MAKRRYETTRDRTREENIRRILAYIRKYHKEHNFPPSMMEIAEACFMSRASVMRHLDLLEARGYITRIPYVPRSISLVDDDDRLH